MDNIETTEPIGSDGATPSQDNSAIDTQPAESTDSVSDGDVVEAGDASHPWDNDTRFKGKTPEEMFETFKEAEQMKGQLSQKASLINQLEQRTGMTAQQLQEMLAQKEQQRMEAAIRENPGLAAFQEVQSLKSQLALQAEEKELDSYLQSEEGKPYAPFRDKILNLGLKMETDKTYDEIAREYFGSARAQGQQDAYKKIDTKVMTQATGVSQAPAKGKVTLEDMKTMSTKEMETFLPWADISERL